MSDLNFASHYDFKDVSLNADRYYQGTYEVELTLTSTENSQLKIKVCKAFDRKKFWSGIFTDE